MATFHLLGDPLPDGADEPQGELGSDQRHGLADPVPRVVNLPFPSCEQRARACSVIAVPVGANTNGCPRPCLIAGQADLGAAVVWPRADVAGRLDCAFY
jgi:hypothetical protein